MNHKAYRNGFARCGARPMDGGRVMRDSQVECEACLCVVREKRARAKEELARVEAAVKAREA